MYNFKDLDSRLADSMERLSMDMRSIQTGRATPMVLDNVYVSAYGSKMLVAHVATISIEDSKTLRVSPFDKSTLKDLEQGINEADLGLSVASDSDGLRVIFPLLTTDRRTQYVKLAKERLEEAKVRAKMIREDVKKDIEQKAKAGEYSDDEKKKNLDTLQDKIDKVNSESELNFAKKEEEIMGN